MNVSIDHCWNKIGVGGDSSCPQLKTVIHCRNCSVYGAAGRTLLQREAPDGYLEEWTELLTQELQQQGTSSTLKKRVSLASESMALSVFRVAQEWVALPVSVIKEITYTCPIHTLPHRSNHVFLGIVNIRGEILMCISLRDLLGLPLGDFNSHNQRSNELNIKNKNNISPVTYKRMIVLEIQANRWVFPVDEVLGVYRFSPDQLRDTPVVISKTPDTYTKKIIAWQGKYINYLDHELVFYELLFYTLNRA
ncbi:chemotaxis protein CheW [Aphanothece sacrum]|uniref:Chemotaxis protein CheW n=1 Tax=Aphanothece sacrum FPU1 TaxID=1920663 RepID=A0A401INL6_APHSA|nr:chemotaxis protein CheW [Aphanothece sacrum]GBF82832.1 chemotaxis protein CheW [Aphanothece sacrum FPU1]GBF85933.1 chemotaxis protein CheW [Aphanothece sacrum FPU3]